MKQFLIRKMLLSITITMLSAIVLVIVLASNSYQPKFLHSSFSRSFPPTGLKLVEKVKLDPALWRVVGATKTKYYLQGQLSDRIYSVDKNLQNWDTLQMTPGLDPAIQSNFEFFVDSPWIYTFAKNVPAILRTNIAKGYTERINLPKFPYTRAVKISDSVFVFRGFDSTVKTQDQIFIKYNLVTGESKRAVDYIDMNNDAGMATDGLLHYDAKSGNLVYVLFYRSDKLFFDSEFNKVSYSKTLDTLSVSFHDAGGIKTGKEYIYTNTGPRRTINNESFVSDGVLYNFSYIKSMTDDESFSHYSVIDKFDVGKDEYLGSFKIPYIDGEKVRTFAVFGDTLTVVYKHTLAKYSLK